MEPDIDHDDLISRYIDVWNEPDAGVRAAAIAALWAEDGAEFTESAEHRGHRALERRIGDAHERLVRRGGFVFRAAGDATGRRDVLRFTAYMVPAGGGAVAWTCAVVIRLAADGRILEDHQFSDPPAADAATGEPPGTRAAVAEYLARCRAGDPDRIADLYADDVDWRVSWPDRVHPAVPWIRPRATRADVADHHRTFAAHCPPADGRVTVERVLVDGPDAVLFGTSEQRVAATGERFAMAFALRLTVEDGLITRHHMHEDSLAVVRAFAPSGQESVKPG